MSYQTNVQLGKEDAYKIFISVRESHTGHQSQAVIIYHSLN